LPVQLVNPKFASCVAPDVMRISDSLH